MINNKLYFFSGFFERFLNEYNNKCIELEKKCKRKMRFSSVEEYIYAEIFDVTYLTLIYELNLFRELGRLSGNNSKERYESFEKIIQSEKFYEYLKEKYPVMENLIIQKIQHTIKCVENISRYFYNDIKEIQHNISANIHEIVDIKIGAGDAHEYGKTVAIVICDNGKVVYKPHQMDNDLVLNRVYDFLDQKVRCKPRKLKIISKEEHGWQEYIEYAECKTEREVGNYYYRLGCFCAIFYLFNSSDMHFENIIASGEYPYVIDTETLITPSKIKKLDFNREIHNYPVDNVLSSSLLPLNNKNSIIDVDMSGLSGGNFDSEKIKAYKILEPGTDRMKVIREKVKTKTEQNNVPRINKSLVDVIAYKKYFLEGFEAACKSFVENKDIIQKWFASGFLDNTIQRQLYRNTYVYARFLEAAQHPTYLTSYKKRMQLLENIAGDFTEKSDRIAHEIKVLNEGYIPSYYTVYNSKDLYSGGELVQKECFRHTAKETIQYKLSSLTEMTILLQEHIVNMAYMTLCDDLFVKKEYDFIDFYCNYTEGFRALFDNIVKYNLVNPEDLSNDIYMIRMNQKGQSLQGLDLSVYEGGGLIWAMFCYARQIMDYNIEKIALSWLDSAERKHRKFLNNPGMSLFTGQGSYIYLYYNFFKATNNKKYRDMFVYYLEVIQKELSKDVTTDFMHGISGIVYLIYKLLQKEKMSLLKDIMMESIEIIDNKLETIVESSVTGIAHGLSGMAIGLISAYAYTKNEKYIMPLKRMLNREMNMLDEENYSWCRGIGGMALARAMMLDVSENIPFDLKNELIKQFHKCLNLLINHRYGGKDNLCLCHGIYGDYDILNTLYTSYGRLLTDNEKNVIGQRIEYMQLPLVKAQPERLWLDYDCLLESFMLGTSGIAYSLLRLFNNKYPSILNLELL